MPPAAANAVVVIRVTVKHVTLTVRCCRAVIVRARQRAETLTRRCRRRHAADCPHRRVFGCAVVKATG